MKNEAKPRVYDILARPRGRRMCEHVLALLGDANMNWPRACPRRNAAWSMSGTSIARSLPPWRTRERTGKWAWRTVTCGPGVTQLIHCTPRSRCAPICRWWCSPGKRR